MADQKEISLGGIGFICVGIVLIALAIMQTNEKNVNEKINNAENVISFIGQKIVNDITFIFLSTGGMDAVNRTYGGFYNYTDRNIYIRSGMGISQTKNICNHEVFHYYADLDYRVSVQGNPYGNVTRQPLEEQHDAIRHGNPKYPICEKLMEEIG